MGFKEAIRTCFSKFATFEGRARRAEFWMFYLFLSIVSGAGYILLMVIGVFSGIFVGTQSEPSPVGLVPFFIAFGLYFLAMIVLMIPYLAALARRLHDMGQSGHWLWLSLVGFAIVPVIMAFFDSEWGPNRWGEDPKAAERVGYAQQQHYAQQQYAQQYGYAQQQYAQPQYGHDQYGQQHLDPHQQRNNQQPPANPPQPPPA